MSEEKNAPPIQTLRDGDVFVKLWRQESEKNGPFVSVTVGRTYKDPQTNEYKEAHSFSGSKILKLEALLGEANKEQIKWRKYFRTTEPVEGTPEPNTPEAVADRDAALQEQSQSASPTMAEHRDTVMANAEPAVKEPGHSPARQR